MDTIRSQTQGSNSQNSIPSDQITSNISSSQTADASRDQIASNVGSRQTANTSNTPITSATASTGVQLSTPPRVEPVVINLATPVATPSPILPNLGSHTIERPLSRVWVRSEDPPTTVTPQSRTIPVRPASATQTPPRASPDDLAQIKQLLTNLVNGQRDHETRLERHERRLAESRNITSPPPRTQLDFSTIYASGVPQAQFVTPSRPQVSQTFGPPPSSPPVGINNTSSHPSETRAQPNVPLSSPPPGPPGTDPARPRWFGASAFASSSQAMPQFENQLGATYGSQPSATAREHVNGNYQQFPSSNANRNPADPRNLVDSESFERFQDRTDLAFQHMSSMFHQATSSAPDIDRVIKESRRTPFSLRIKSTYIRDTSKLRIPEYSGNSDPRAYMRAFNLVVSRVPFSPEEIEAAYCRLFAENLIGPAQEWFSTLDENSIDNFDQLQSAFLKQYSIFIESKITEADLWRLSQGPKESLRSYIDRFKSVKAKITNPNEAVALLALKNNLWYESKFREELTVRPTISLDDALHRASAFATLEEDTALLREKYLKGELAYAPPGAKKTAPAKPPSQSKGQHSYSIETSAPIKSSEEEEKHCDIHNTNGHSTEECRAKGKKSSKKKGKSKTAETAVKAEKPKPKPAKDSDNAPQKREREVEVEAPDSPPSNRKRIDLIFGELSLCGGSTRSVVTPPPAPRKATSSSSHRPPRLVGGIEHSYRSSPVTSPTSRPDTKSIAISCLRRLHKLSGGVEPPTPKRIDFICGGSKMCKDSINSIKAHQRRVESSGQPRPLDGPDHEIKFRESETLALDKPHDDALVIELAVAGFELTRVMIDTGSSVDVLFYDAFKRMGFENSALIGGRTPLTGFAGETTYSMGTIQLPIKAGGITKTVDFVVVDRPAPFNAILGRPWLYTMKAVASTYHQCVKFPTPWGTKTIRGCQRASRDCYMGSYLRAEKSPVCIDETDPERRVGIGIDLAKPIRDELIAFLKENISTFAWSTADMPGIDTRITSHELNVDPTFKPMKQKRRKLGPDRAKAVNDEVDRLLKLLRGNKKFLWDEKCEEAFKQLKTYLSEPPILAKPVEGEPLYLYIAVSPAAVSGVLVREELNEQRPIFYVSKSLIDAETRYPAMEKLALAIVMSARKLRPYFQSHTIVVMTSQPLRTMLHSPSQSGRLAKWAIELSEYDIEYRTRTCAKAQVLADFMIELAPEANNDTTLSKVWTLFVDGASSKQGAGVGIKLTSPTGEVIEQSFRLGFVASNNEAEYEALIAGLRLAIGIGVNEINAFSDSQLVTSQYSGEYEAKEERMEAYLKVVRDLAGQFSKFELTRVPRGENTSADALAALASTSDPTVRRVIPVEGIDKPSIDIALKSDSINAITSRPSTRSQTRQSQDPGPSNPEPDSEEEEPDQDRQKTRYIDSDSSQNTQESTIHTVPSAMANELTLKEEFARDPTGELL
ncbi:unnamed protein product [Microthlaspi erraticum]|uniref:RNase H type-1 domain-containing protein n=1 Tax=Microthlaspi erraticum TaxID=1685480 RepID=A0A6D2HUI1_9BRAS|nr:unnamed protein product [Microthlaspi erraticum]